MFGWHYGLNGMSLNNFWEMVKDRDAWHAEFHGLAKSQTKLRDQIIMKDLLSLLLSRRL